MSQLLSRAFEFFDANRPDLAETLVRDHLKQAPEDFQAHSLLGLCLTVRKQFEEAEQVIGRALELAPDQAYPHYSLACCLFDSNRVIEASGAIARAMERNPAHVPSHYVNSLVRFRQARYGEALKSAEEGLRLDPSNLYCMTIRIDTLRMLGRKDEAAEVSRELLRLHPNHPYSHSSAGLLLLAQSRFGMARTHFQEALRLNPLDEVPIRGLSAATYVVPLSVAGVLGGLTALGSLVTWFISKSEGAFVSAQWVGFAMSAIGLLAPVPSGKALRIKICWNLACIGCLSLVTWWIPRIPGPEFASMLLKTAFTVGVIGAVVSPLLALRLAWLRS